MRRSVAGTAPRPLPHRRPRPRRRSVSSARTPEPASRRGPTEEPDRVPRRDRHRLRQRPAARRRGRAVGITVVPLVVSFGAESFRPGVDLTTDGLLGADDRARRAVPDDRRRRRPATSRRAFEAAFAGGADAVVCVNVSGDLSGTLKSAQVARQQLPEGREIHVIDSRTASMGHGHAGPDRRRSWPPRASPRPRSPGSSSTARRTSTCSSPSTRSSTSSAAAGSAAPARRSARCSRSSRSSPSRTGSSRTRTGSDPARRRANGSSSC